MRDKYYQLVKIPSSDDYLNNADGLRRAASPEFDSIYIKEGFGVGISGFAAM
jgi:hypothetical protein